MQLGTAGISRRHPQISDLRISERRRKARLAHIPLPVALLLIAMLLPGEFDFYLGTLRLNSQRLVLLALMPVAIVRLFSGKIATFRSFDCLFLAAFVYFAFAMFMKESFDRAIVASGILLLEALGGYLVARAYIRNEAQFLATVKLLFSLVMIVGVFAALEAVSHNHWARNLAAALTGSPTWPVGETRIGLLRAMTVFDHPILSGVFCASVFALVWFAEPTSSQRLIRSMLCAAATFFSLSSAPLLMIGFVLLAALWERASRNVPHRAWLTIFIISLLYFLLSLVTNRSPFRVFVTSFVFESGNAWYRMLIWDYGVENVLNNPWFGTRLGFWDRPAWMPNDTLDNYWLATAIWGGLPSVGLLVLSIVTLLRTSNRPQVGETAERRRCRYAWTATVLALCLVGATVHYWGTLAVYFVFCLGLGAWLADGERNIRPLRREKMRQLSVLGNVSRINRSYPLVQQGARRGL